MKFNKQILFWGAVLALMFYAVTIAVTISVLRSTVQAEDIFLPITIGEGEPLVLARASSRNLVPGDVLTVNCSGTSLSGEQSSPLTVIIRCNGGATPLPTATAVIAPTATLVPPTATVGVPPTATAVVPPTATAMTMPAADLYWHAPGAHGDRPSHEHGDAPPAWLAAAGITPSFTHVAGTPNENHFYWKHTGFKGFAATMDGVDFYFVGHWDFNPGGHNSRFHSYQIWFRDGTGAISHMSGWQDFGTGDNATGQKIISCGANSNIRPIININAERNANGQACQIFFETWYANTGGQGSGAWSIDTGVSINPNYYALRAGGSISDPSTWTPTGGIRNLTRRLEIAWYADRSPLRGAFVTDQWGRVRTGMTDPLCGTPRVIGGVTYTVACIEQYIAPTLTSITFPENAQQRTFAGNGVVQLPN